MKNKDLPVGSKFESLTTVSETFMKAFPLRNRRFVDVQCDCGSSVKSVYLNDLIAGRIKTCGCARSTAEQSITHGLSSHPLYSVWACMKKRCDNPAAYKFEDYGGRGISYQESWKYFEEFYSDMADGYSPDLELDREDTNDNYTKENCRWVTRSVNCHNRRKRKNSKCQSIGVSTRNGKFRAMLNIDGVCKLSKTFDTEEEAAMAYDDCSEECYGDRPNKTTRLISPKP